jgi:hypothetical protein
MSKHRIGAGAMGLGCLAISCIAFIAVSLTGAFVSSFLNPVRETDEGSNVTTSKNESKVQTAIENAYSIRPETKPTRRALSQPVQIRDQSVTIKFFEKDATFDLSLQTKLDGLAESTSLATNQQTTVTSLVGEWSRTMIGSLYSFSTIDQGELIIGFRSSENPDFKLFSVMAKSQRIPFRMQWDASLSRAVALDANDGKSILIAKHNSEKAISFRLNLPGPIDWLRVHDKTLLVFSKGQLSLWDLEATEPKLVFETMGIYELPVQTHFGGKIILARRGKSVCVLSGQDGEEMREFEARVAGSIVDFGLSPGAQAIAVLYSTGSFTPTNPGDTSRIDSPKHENTLVTWSPRGSYYIQRRSESRPCFGWLGDEHSFLGEARKGLFEVVDLRFGTTTLYVRTRLEINELLYASFRSDDGGFWQAIDYDSSKEPKFTRLMMRETVERDFASLFAADRQIVTLLDEPLRITTGPTVLMDDAAGSLAWSLGQNGIRIGSDAKRQLKVENELIPSGVTIGLGGDKTKDWPPISFTIPRLRTAWSIIDSSGKTVFWKDYTYKNYQGEYFRYSGPKKLDTDSVAFHVDMNSAMIESIFAARLLTQTANVPRDIPAKVIVGGDDFTHFPIVSQVGNF